MSRAGSFVRINNTGGPVDVCVVEGVDEAELVGSPEGHCYLPTTVPAARVRRHRRDIPAEEW